MVGWMPRVKGNVTGKAQLVCRDPSPSSVRGIRKGAVMGGVCHCSELLGVANAIAACGYAL